VLAIDAHVVHVPEVALVVMERRLLRVIMNPAMVVVWLTGPLLAWELGAYRDRWLDGLDLRTKLAKGMRALRASSGSPLAANLLKTLVQIVEAPAAPLSSLGLHLGAPNRWVRARAIFRDALVLSTTRTMRPSTPPRKRDHANA